MVNTMHACMQDVANYDRKMQLIRVVEMKTVHAVSYIKTIGSKQLSYNVYSCIASLIACMRI